MTIQDSSVVAIDHLAYNFFLNMNDIGSQVYLIYYLTFVQLSIIECIARAGCTHGVAESEGIEFIRES